MSGSIRIGLVQNGHGQLREWSWAASSLELYGSSAADAARDWNMAETISSGTSSTIEPADTDRNTRANGGKTSIKHHSTSKPLPSDCTRASQADQMQYQPPDSMS
jgi:hypothetical protein